MMSRTHRYAAEPVPEGKQIATKKQNGLWSAEDIALCAAFERAIYGDTPLARKLKKDKEKNGRHTSEASKN